MATELKLDIVTPSEAIYSGPAAQVVIPAWEGELGIFPNHDTLLALLRPGIVTTETPTGTHRYVVSGGFADISGSAVTLLTDACVATDRIDKASAQEMLSAAEAAMSQLDATTEAYKQAAAQVAHATVLLSA